VRQELLHQSQQRIEDERHEVMGALRVELSCRNEPLVWRRRVVQGIELAGRGANPLGQGGDGIGVAEISGDHVCARAITGQILSEHVERLPVAGDEHHLVALSSVAASDRPAETRTSPEHSNRPRHATPPSNASFRPAQSHPAAAAPA
jgi:hypothetical protein